MLPRLPLASKSGQGQSTCTSALFAMEALKLTVEDVDSLCGWMAKVFEPAPCVANC
jgi:hypothetical protein